MTTFVLVHAPGMATKMGNKIKRDIRSVLGQPLLPETCQR